MSDLEDNLAVRGFVSVLNDDGTIDPDRYKLYLEQKAQLRKEYWDYIFGPQPTTTDESETEASE